MSGGEREDEDEWGDGERRGGRVVVDGAAVAVVMEKKKKNGGWEGEERRCATAQCSSRIRVILFLNRRECAPCASAYIDENWGFTREHAVRSSVDGQLCKGACVYGARTRTQGWA